ncbi:histidinol dehydrogenase [Euryhalocaulis caribicus]|uniref:histidinol dehydrogenase n=1 Tax=Euryhalocaulis caribicus TaxID=1161401 RepID=UPI00039C64BE|nr:histidinol dehydrogenase [Euryhalocaulis caribicus]
MRWLDWNNATEAERAAALARPAARIDRALRDRVIEILDDVAAKGAAAVDEWALEIDGAAVRKLDAGAISRAAEGALNKADRAAVIAARDAVTRFHEAVRPKDSPRIETVPGIECQRVWRPLDTVGLYIPGGTAPLLSTLIMLVIPARIAGVRRIAAVTPPDKDGELPPVIAAAAELCGLEEIWLAGGAQAVAAMAYGAGMPRCDKIFGPGNAWVAEAKRQASQRPGGPAIDMPAGPSELMVIADASADPDIVAADLLSQAEHDPYAQIVLAAEGEAVAHAVQDALARQIDMLPRGEIARASLAEGLAIIVSSADEAAAAAEAYAPEHLSLNIENADAMAARITRAGTVFIGAYASESFGDYCAGPNHVLPTDGAARAWSGLSVDSFMRAMTLQTVTARGARDLAPTAARLARLEGLEAHARAAEFRR